CPPARRRRRQRLPARRCAPRPPVPRSCLRVSSSKQALNARQWTFAGCHLTTSFSIIVISRKKAPEKSELMITAEYRSAESKLYVAWMMSAPMPRVEPIHSPTTAPITDVDAAIFNAENRYGNELYSRNLKKISDLLADSTRINSIDCGFTASSPRTILTS